ncbi:MAG TPA: hypothetical protein PKD45_00920 [Flavobacteriales bacterium]|nr:hypothetical protein [Flavobacteriales bacterium]
MKHKWLPIGIGAALCILSLFNFTLAIDSKGHYFGNGIVFGIGVSIMVRKIRQLTNAKRKDA